VQVLSIVDREQCFSPSTRIRCRCVQRMTCASRGRREAQRRCACPHRASNRGGDRCRGCVARPGQEFRIKRRGTARAAVAHAEQSEGYFAPHPARDRQAIFFHVGEFSRSCGRVSCSFIGTSNSRVTWVSKTGASWNMRPQRRSMAGVRRVSVSQGGGQTVMLPAAGCFAGNGRAGRIAALTTNNKAMISRGGYRVEISWETGCIGGLEIRIRI